MFDKPSSDGMRHFGFAAISALLLLFGLEGGMWTMFYAVYTETIGLMNETYLSELPVIGAIFAPLDPDANASHIISMLLATFSVGTPLFIWAEIFRQDILDDPQEWFSYPQNQIVALLAGLILILVLGLEITNLYTLVARESMQGGFVDQTDQSGLMAFLAENKGLAIGVSIVIAVINIVLAMFTTRATRNLKS
jgi:hypothetical protein